MSRHRFPSAPRLSAPCLSARRLPRIAGSAALVGLSLVASPALARDELSVDLSAQAGVATNPFLTSGSSPTTGTGTLGIRPSWVNESEFTTLQVNGYVGTSFYTEDYGTNTNVSLQGSGTHRLSERTTLTAALGYVNTIVGSFNGIGGPLGVSVSGLPVVGIVPTTGGSATGGTVPGGSAAGGTVAPAPVVSSLPYVLTDPALGQIGRRQRTYLASAGISTALSARDQVAFNIAAALNRANGTVANDLNTVGGNDFNTVTPTVSYSRVLGERFSVGATFSVGFTDYLGTDLGDAKIYQPALTVTRGIGERWTLTATLGAAITKVNGIGGDSRSTTSFNGNANLCRQDERWNACFNASRQTVPSTFQGVRTQTSVGASLGYRLSDRDDLSFNGGYSHAGNPVQRDLIDGPRDGSVDFANAIASYSRRITPALFGTATLGYTKAFDDLAKRDANYTALVGVTYRLGRKR